MRYRLAKLIAIVIATLLAFNAGALVWADDSRSSRNAGTLGFGFLFGYAAIRLVNWWHDRGRRCDRCSGLGKIPRDVSSIVAGDVRDRVCPECFGAGRRVVELHRWS